MLPSLPQDCIVRRKNNNLALREAIPFKKIRSQSHTIRKYFYICFKNNKKQNDDIKK